MVPPIPVTRHNAWPLARMGLRELRGRVQARLRGEGSREEEALRFVREQAPRGDAEAVLEALDRFARERRFLMNVGDEKGRALDRIVLDVAPLQALELGAYCGYSAVRIGRLLAPTRGRLLSVERSPENAAISRAVVAHAGLGDTVEVVVGASESTLLRVERVFNLVFIDHAKERYLADLQLLEQRAMLAPGAVVIADNVGMFEESLADYLAHVRGAGGYESHVLPFPMEYNPGIEDGLEISTRAR